MRRGLAFVTSLLLIPAIDLAKSEGQDRQKQNFKPCAEVASPVSAFPYSVYSSINKDTFGVLPLLIPAQTVENTVDAKILPGLEKVVKIKFIHYPEGFNKIVADALDKKRVNNPAFADKNWTDPQKPITQDSIQRMSINRITIEAKRGGISSKSDSTIEFIKPSGSSLSNMDDYGFEFATPEAAQRFLDSVQKGDITFYVKYNMPITTESISRYEINVKLIKDRLIDSKILSKDQDKKNVFFIDDATTIVGNTILEVSQYKYNGYRPDENFVRDMIKSFQQKALDMKFMEKIDVSSNPAWDQYKLFIGDKPFNKDTLKEYREKKGNEMSQAATSMAEGASSLLKDATTEAEFSQKLLSIMKKSASSSNLDVNVYGYGDGSYDSSAQSSYDQFAHDLYARGKTASKEELKNSFKNHLASQFASKTNQEVEWNGEVFEIKKLSLARIVKENTNDTLKLTDAEVKSTITEDNTDLSISSSLKTIYQVHKLSEDIVALNEKIGKLETRAGVVEGRLDASTSMDWTFSVRDVLVLGKNKHGHANEDNNTVVKLASYLRYNNDTKQNEVWVQSQPIPGTEEVIRKGLVAAWYVPARFPQDFNKFSVSYAGLNASGGLLHLFTVAGSDDIECRIRVIIIHRK